ncbi:AAA family ATPase [Aquitalea palustris]|uniref:AAA family ATPase n=1 Tax=Aquitalea palustris TaxID=2480983 RepID=UPI00131462F0|nr:AAA family ATPase [Aquitalea palustris]
MKLNSLRVRNFRGFLDTGIVSLKPINLMIGKNSIGKSSFLRIWPLFSQGSLVNKTSPILWNGNLVDFGSFGDVISRYSDNKIISFEFEMLHGGFAQNYKRSVASKAFVRMFGPSRVKVSIDVGTNETRTIYKNLILDVYGYRVEYHFSDDGVLNKVSCGPDNLPYPKYYTIVPVQSFLMPLYDFLIETKVDNRLIPAYSPLYMNLFWFLRNRLHGRLSDERVHEIAAKLRVMGSEDAIIKLASNLPYAYATWKKFISEVLEDKILASSFARAVVMAASELLLADMDSDIKKYFEAVNYIRPIRATAERYYRKQELSVENIDATGSNVAFFIKSLDRGSLNRLNDWLNDTLGIKVATHDAEGHVSIKIEDTSTGRIDNIADIGFGFSQALPLAVQAWLAFDNGRSSTSSKGAVEKILVWEQPELHLHPAMQRKLARLIATVVEKARNESIKFVIETHSQSMVNEIGDLIERQTLSHEDVQILLFEQESGGSTVIRTTGYDEEGQLINWPYGFLSV